MFEIDQKPVPAPVLQALQDSVDTVSPRLLLDYARSRADLMKGLSPRPDSAPILRKRVKSLITARRKPDPELLDLLRESSLFGQFTVVLSEKALAHGFLAFCAYLGEPAFLAGLLLDPRDSMRALAWEHLQAHPEADASKTQTPEEARATLESDFAPFLARIAGLKVKIAAAEKTADPAELQELRAKLRRFEDQERREERAAEKEKQALVREKEQHRVKLEDLENKLREQRAKTAQAESCAKNAAQSLTDAQDDLHRRVREGIEAELSSETRRWLLPLRAMESAAHSHKGSVHLLGDVRETLRQQAERDRVTGNRQELRKRLDVLRQHREDVRDALQNALNRHPRLAELAEALDREIESLAGLLGEPAPAGAAENALLTRVNGAESVEELEAVRAFLDGPAKSFALFPPGFSQELARRIADRRAVLLKAMIPVDAAPVAERPSDQFRHKLALPALRVLVLVDGHNLLLSRPDLFQPWLENDQPGARAREALANRLAALLETARDCDIRLYFDGPERSETDRTPALKVIYSGGGTKEQRADQAILQDLEFYAPRYEGCYVVTDDTELLAQAERPGVHGRALNQMAGLL